MTPTVAIIGRPNVGKSTLFNRLIGQRKAIVDDQPGVTRDRLYGEVEWNGHHFFLVDTGGFVPYSADVYEKAIRQQLEIAIAQADLLLFLVDATSGLTPAEEELASQLRPHASKVVLVVNKIDHAGRLASGLEFYRLGFDHVFFVSAINGSGTGDLLDFIVSQIPATGTEPTTDLPYVAIVGQPNVGKSSLLNVLLGEPRALVTAQAGTTRDPIHSRYKRFNKEFILVDTAGLRKKANVHENLEFYAVLRAVRAIDRADVCVLMTDARTPMQKQDLHILSLIARKKKGVVLAVNKWDLVAYDSQTMTKIKSDIIEKIAPFTDIPILFISVLRRQRIYQLVEAILKVYENKLRRIPQEELTQWLSRTVSGHPHPPVKGRLFQFYSVRQQPTASPQFVFTVNFPDEVQANYRQWLEKQLRAAFPFQGVPLTLVFQKK